MRGNIQNSNTSMYRVQYLVIYSYEFPTNEGALRLFKNQPTRHIFPYLWLFDNARLTEVLVFRNDATKVCTQSLFRLALVVSQTGPRICFLASPTVQQRREDKLKVLGPQVVDSAGLAERLLNPFKREWHLSTNNFLTKM